MQTRVILALLVLLAVLCLVTAIKKPPATQIPGCDPACRPGLVCCKDGKIHDTNGKVGASVDFGSDEAATLSRRILARKIMSRRVQQKCDNYCRVGRICCATGTLVRAI
jgi:hypothetical protein